MRLHLVDYLCCGTGLASAQIVRLHGHGHRLGGHAAVVSHVGAVGREFACAGVLRPRRRRVGSIVPPPTLRLRASA